MLGYVGQARRPGQSQSGFLIDLSHESLVREFSWFDYATGQYPLFRLPR
nr:hypothetical protein [Streptomyces pluripotens]